MGASVIESLFTFVGKEVWVNPTTVQPNMQFPLRTEEANSPLMARDTLNHNNGPSPVLGRLWFFAIMILAILCGLTGITSLVLHLNQSRRRRSLRRRIAAGEVDLEMLGVRRQRVPQKLLTKMPLYVYTSKNGFSTSSGDRDKASASQSTSPFHRHKLPKRDVPFSQTTCAICLDDFQHNETVVRELPCRHIFHPECVDDFLRTNSSLCPICKKSALPIGYCPEDVTISMVRRERMMRRMREEGNTSVRFSYILPSWSHRFLPDTLLRRHIRPLQGAEIRRTGRNPPHNGFPANSDSQGRPSNVEDTAQVASSSSVPPETIPLPPSPTLSSTSPPLLHSQSQSRSDSSPASSSAQATPSGDLEMAVLASGSNHNSDPPVPSSSEPEPAPQSLEDVPPEIQALSPEERREWGRQRLIANLPPPQADPVAEERDSEARVTGWRRGWRKLFPA